MAGAKKLILFDIDHTLFDTRIYLDLCFRELFRRANAQDVDRFLLVCHEIYRDMRKSTPNAPFFVQEFIDTLVRDLKLSGDIHEYEDVFVDANIIQTSIYSDVHKELQQLSSISGTTLGIFSTGVHQMQEAKIASLEQVLSQEHIFINEVDKVLDIPRVLEKHQEDEIFVVDDLSPVLYSFKSKEESVVTILIQRDESSKELVNENYRPDYTIRSLSELKNIII